MRSKQSSAKVPEVEKMGAYLLDKVYNCKHRVVLYNPSSVSQGLFYRTRKLSRSLLILREIPNLVYDVSTLPTGIGED